MFKVSLDFSWSKDSPSCEAPGFPEPADPEIQKNRKNVFNEYFLRPKKYSSLKNKLFKTLQYFKKDLYEGLQIRMENICSVVVSNNLVGNIASIY